MSKRYKDSLVNQHMEFLTIVGIFMSEGIKGIWNRKFNMESFWNRCIRVNILYTKFFQSLCGTYLYSSVHSIPFSYEEFEPTFPVTKMLGSGLISIVYESEWEGKPVVVKTKRKHIDTRIHSSIDSMEWYLEWIHWMYPIPTILLAFYEIKDSFLTQLDYLQEINSSSPA